MLILCVFVFIVRCLSLSAGASPASSCSFHQGQDCSGNDIVDKPANDPGACCNLCSTQPGCKAFTWDSYNRYGQRQGTCYMKSGCPTLNSKGDCTAGILSGPNPPGPGPGPAPTPSPSSRPKLPTTPTTERAASIVAQMTQDEKASILNGMHSAAYGDSHNGYYVGNTPAIPRLKVPSLNMQDAAQGFRTIDRSQYGQVTSWPCSLAVAANWDRNATYKWGVALGKEFRAKGANMILGPSLNVHRVPRGGRNAEVHCARDSMLGAVLMSLLCGGGDLACISGITFQITRAIRNPSNLILTHIIHVHAPVHFGRRRIPRLADGL